MTAEQAADAAAVATGARWMSLSQVITQVTRIVSAVVLAALLGPRAFGLITIATVVVMFVDVFKDLGTGTAVIQRREVTQSLLSTVFALNVMVGVVLVAAIAGTAPLVASVMGDREATPVLRVISVVVLITAATQVHHALLRRQMRFDAVAAVNVSGALTNAVAAIGLALVGAGVWSLVVGAIMQTSVAAALAWRLSSWRPSRALSLAELRQVGSFSANVAGFNLTNFALVHSDKIIVGAALGSTSLGVYSIAQRLLMYPIQSIAQVVQDVAFPAFARRQDDLPAIRRGYLRATAVIAFITFPLMSGLAVIAEPLVAVVFSDQWAELVPLIWVLGPVAALQSVMSCVSTVFTACGRADLLFRLGIVNGVLGVSAYLIGLRWGLMGVVVAYTIVVVVMAVPQLRFALGLMEMRLNVFLLNLFPYAAMAVAMCAVVGLAVHVLAQQSGLSSLGRVALGVVLGVLTYGGAALVAKAVALDDLLNVVTGRRPSQAQNSVSQ